MDTVRFWEKHGVLPEAQRLESGYRVYTQDDVKRLQFIKRAKALGFTLDDIVDLLGLSQRRDGDMAAMREKAQERLADVDAKIAELQRMRKGLRSLVTACPGEGAMETCPIVKALSGK